MKKKTCNKCNKEKSVKQFYMKYDEYYINPCKTCYKKNRKIYVEKKKLERMKILRCDLPQGTYEDGTKIPCRARAKTFCLNCKRTFCLKCSELLQYGCFCTPPLLDIKNYNAQLSIPLPSRPN